MSMHFEQPGGDTHIVDPFDEVKRLVPLEDYFINVLGADLRPQGDGQLVCKSPWREERTPSLFIYLENASWHDFGDGSGGSIIDAVMQQENFEEPVEALRWLNEHYNLRLQIGNWKHAERAEAAKKKIAEARAEMDDEKSSAAKRARDILHGRGFSDSTIDAFDLAVDRKAARIIIPIHEKGGHPIGWSGRAMINSASCSNCGHETTAKDAHSAARDAQPRDDSGPWWENDVAVAASMRCLNCSTDQALPKFLANQHPKYRFPAGYERRKHLYNMHRATRALRAQDRSVRQPILVMEGYADVWACHEAGFPGSVAYNGGNLSDHQASVLVEAVTKTQTWIGLVADTDATGRINTDRNIRTLRAINPAVDIRVLHGIADLSTPSGLCKDAGDVIEHHGKQVLSELLRGSWWSADEYRIREVLAGDWDRTQQQDLVRAIVATARHTLMLDSLIPVLADAWDISDHRIIRDFIHSHAGSQASLQDSASMMASISGMEEKAREFLEFEDVLTTDFDEMNEHYPGGGFSPGTFHMILGRSGTGKAQPLDAKVLTPHGWKLMGDIDSGDLVVNPDGGTAEVIGVYPQGPREIVRVEFSDGAATECDLEHLWTVRTSSDGAWKTVTLREILREDLTTTAHYVPLRVVSMDSEFDEDDEETFEKLGRMVGQNPSLWPTVTESIKATRSSALRSAVYLRGLLEVRGTYHPDGSISLRSKHQGMTSEIETLVRSVGGTVSASPKDRRLTISVPLNVHQILNAEHAVLRTGDPDRRIVRVSAVGEKPAQCIMLNSKSQLYITDDYVVTHNTTFVINLIWQFIRRHKVPVMFFSLEMPQAQLYIQFVQVTLGVRYKEAAEMIKSQDPRLDEVRELYERYLTVVDAVPDESGEVDPITPERVKRLIQDANLTRGGDRIKVLFIDHLGIMTPDAGATQNAKDNPSLGSGYISKRLFSITKQFGLITFMLQQMSLNGAAPGEPVTMASSRGSTESIDFLDSGIGIYRPELKADLTEDEKIACRGKYMVNLFKNRFGPTNMTGVCLHYAAELRRVSNDPTQQNVPAEFVKDPAADFTGSNATASSVLIDTTPGRSFADALGEPDAVIDSAPVGDDEQLPAWFVA